ncbi:SNF2-related protein [Ferviditalea candida]|uniref:DEAD/DEAH box helicase n=1 Tax=Ferviditalea candida TaxID=3108399 RepID=A0ABU5ZKR4_9BACL|nr:DEAD/DEAH box helicase [Paenibacillaceae bacterium T2]
MRIFETTTDLLPHQIDAMNKLLPSRINALLMEMGTGKSRTVIELAKYRSRKIDKVVWFCPVSLKQTVLGEILKHTYCTREDICVFNDEITEKTIPDAMWYVIGIESMSSSARVILTAHKLITEKTFVILDESTYCKYHRAKRTMRITTFSREARYRAIMTGTPLSKGVQDLYSQFYFLSPKILGYSSFYSFAANHLEYSDKFPGMIVRAHNVEYLAAKIKPYTYQVTKEESLNLPTKLMRTVYFEMSEEQQEAYGQAKYDALDAVEYDRFDRYYIFKLFMWLQQIVSGFWNRNGKLLEYKHDRLSTLMDSIDKLRDDKIIVWAKFQYDIEHIADALRTAYGYDSVALYYGKTQESKRKLEEEKFHKNARFFVGTQSTGGHGLTLNEANRVFFYNNGFKYSEREQAEDRCHRIGQEKDVIYTDIHCVNSIDDRIYKSLSKKSSVLYDFQKEVDKVKKDRIKELIKSL